MAYDDPGNFQNGIGATLGSGPYNDLGFPTLPNYKSGTTNSLGLTPASGGTTINSLDCSGMSDGFTFFIHNESATDNLIFPHLGGGLAGNQFKNQNSGSVAIPPFGAARCTYKLKFLRFA